MKKSLIVLAAVCVLASGCATPEAASDSGKQGEYRTGSNIPRKNIGGDRVGTMKSEDLHRSGSESGTGAR